MTEDQHKLILRHMACTDSLLRRFRKNYVEDKPDDVLEEINQSFGFNIKNQPAKVISILEEALDSHDASSVEFALYSR